MSVEITICTAVMCDRPSDGWFVCRTCADAFEADVLSKVAGLLDDLDDAITNQVRFSTGKHGKPTKPAEMPLPVNLKASDVKGALVSELDTVARVIAGANHWQPVYTTPAECVEWLTYRLAAIRLHPAGGEMMDDIAREFAAAMWIVDRPVPKQYLGDCSEYPRTDDLPTCPGKVYGRKGQPEARCDTCGSTWDADALRRFLFETKLSQSILEASEIADLAMYLGTDLRRERVRKLINLWAHRGIIEKRPLKGDRVGFVAGDVFQRLLLVDAERESA